MKLEYLIMYTEIGTPIYSRCFADMCKNSIGNPILFSAFLASLNQFAQIDPDNLPSEMDLNGETLKIKFDNESDVNYVQLQELELMFFYTSIDNVTIAAGFNSEKYNKEEVEPKFIDFLRDIESLLKNYSGTNWNNVSFKELEELESSLLHDVVYPFFEMNDIESTCVLGDNCPYRVALFEEKGSIFNRIKKKIEQYRKMDLRKLMKNAISG